MTRISINPNADITRDNLIEKSPDETPEMTIENSVTLDLAKIIEPPLVSNKTTENDAANIGLNKEMLILKY